MPWFSFRRDGFMLLVFAVLLVMLGAGLSGAPGWFAYGLVVLLGLLAGLGFVRSDRPVTWLPPLLAAAVLASGFVGMFGAESAVVRGVSDTVLGFHPATAFLIYVVWIPAFFTLGVGFAVLFPYLKHETRGDGPESGREDASR